MAKVMRKEAWHAQRRDQASGNPLFPSIEPQNQSLFYAQLVKNMPAMRETSVRSLGWEDPLEKEKAPHSSIQA